MTEIQQSNPYYSKFLQQNNSQSVQNTTQQEASLIKQGTPVEGDKFDAEWKKVLNVGNQPQFAGETEAPTDPSAKNEFSVFNAGKNLLYGATVGVVKDTLTNVAQHPIKTALCVGAAATFIAATGGTGAILLGAIGAVAGLASTGISTAKAVGKYASGDKKGAEEQFENIGKNVTLTALSVVGQSAAVKAVSGTAKTTSVAASSAEKTGVFQTVINGAKTFFTDTKRAVELGGKFQYRMMTSAAKTPYKFVKTAREEGYNPTRMGGLFKDNLNTEMSALTQNMAQSGRFVPAEIKAVEDIGNLKFGFNLDFLKKVGSNALENPAIMLHDVHKTSINPL